MKLLFLLLLSFHCYAQIPGVVATTNYTTTPDTTGAINDPYIIIDDAVTVGTPGTDGYYFDYHGTWNFGQNVAGWYPESGDPKQTLHYSGITNDSVTFVFNGTGIELYTETKSTLGIMAVSIDYGAETNVDLYAASPTQQVMKFQNMSLTQAVHTLTIRVTGTKNASATNYYGIIDYVRVTNPIEIPVPPSAPSYLYLSPSGNNANTPCTTAGLPCQTIAFINTIAVSGDTVSMAAGTYTEAAYILPPLGVTYKGAGINQTIVKFNSALNHTFVPFDYGDTKYGFQYIVTGTGNQGIMDMTIEGNARGMHGGVYLFTTHNVDFTRVRFENFGFTALNIRFSNDVNVTDCEIVNSSLSLTNFSSGALMYSTCNDLTLDNIFVDETTSGQVRGYGLKAFGPSPTQPVVDDLLMIEPFILVTPTSNYGTGGTANIAIEIHNTLLTDAQIIGGDINENISLVRPDGQTDPGTNAITVDGLYMHPTAGYAMELTYHRAIIRNNFFNGGKYASIFNTDGFGPRATGWEIYGNFFYNPYTAGGQAGGIRSTNYGFLNMNVFNNTFHWLSTSSGVSAMVTFNGGVSSNIQFKNNFIFDQTNAAVMTLNGGGSVSSSTFSYNQLWGLTQGSISGVTYSNNLTSDPTINGNLPRPDPYYRPLTGSPMIESGTNVGLPFTGAAPTRGALEKDPN